MKYLAAPGIIGRTFQNVFIAFLSDILAKFTFGKINIFNLPPLDEHFYLVSLGC